MPFLSQDQVDSYNENGFLHVPDVFDPELLQRMRDELDWMIDDWANKFPGWSGPWRQQYMDEETEKASKLIAMHDLHFYGQAWAEAVMNRKLAEVLSDLLGGDPVENHHTTMHVKPSETGHPFPMHQDMAFYEHTDDRFLDVLAHLDNTSHENGEIRFIPGSHKLGYLPHITEWDGEPCTPHLDWNDYSLDDTVAVPAKAGDVVIFNVNCIHGSHINQTDDMRRMVRMGYRHPDNRQIKGQSAGRPGLMVWGRRERHEGAELFSINGPVSEDEVKRGDHLMEEKAGA